MTALGFVQWLAQPPKLNAPQRRQALAALQAAAGLNRSDGGSVISADQLLRLAFGVINR